MNHDGNSMLYEQSAHRRGAVEGEQVGRDLVLDEELRDKAEVIRAKLVGGQSIFAAWTVAYLQQVLGQLDLLRQAVRRQVEHLEIHNPR